MGMSEKRYVLETGDFDGEATVGLADRAAGLTAVIVPGVGSNLISFRDTAGGVEYLHKPRALAELISAPVGYGNPVLLPPNRIRHGRFTYAGAAYDLPINSPPHHIHGLVHSLPWRVGGRGASEAEGAWVRTIMAGREHPGFSRVFPHDFSLALTFRLRGGTLSILAEAENGGPGPFPFGLGYHTYFRLPISDGAVKEDYRLSLPAAARWELEERFPTGRLLPLSGTDRLEASPVADLGLDDIYTDLAPGAAEIAARLWHGKSGRGVEFASDRSFMHWVVWSGPGPGAPYICLEPYTCLTDAPNLPLPRERTGLLDLAPGGTWRGWIEFRPLR